MNHHPLHLNDVYARSPSRGGTWWWGRWSTRSRSACPWRTSRARRSRTWPPEELTHPAPVFHGDTALRRRPRCSRSGLPQSKPDRGVVKVRTDVYNQRNERSRPSSAPCLFPSARQAEHLGKPGGIQCGRMAADSSDKERIRLSERQQQPSAGSADREHARLRAWVEEVAALTQPGAIHWCDGSAEEYDALCQELVEAGTFERLSDAKRPTPTSRARTPATSRASRTGPSSAPSARGRRADQQLARPAEMRETLTDLFRGLDAGPHDVRRAVLDGPARLADRAHRRAAHRLRLRRGQHADHDPHGAGRARRARRRRRVRALPALGRQPLADGARTCRGRATPTTSTSSTSPRRARSGPTARATAATRCSARSASRCGSPR